VQRDVVAVRAPRRLDAVGHVSRHFAGPADYRQTANGSAVVLRAVVDHGPVARSTIARIVPFDHELPAKAFDRLSAMYDEPARPPGPDRTPALLRESVTIRGFIQTEFAADLMGEFLERATPWVRDGSLKHKEDNRRRPGNAPEASFGMLEGKDFGTLLVRVS
jgi:hypothetical protein